MFVINIENLKKLKYYIFFKKRMFYFFIDFFFFFHIVFMLFTVSVVINIKKYLKNKNQLKH